MAGPPTLNLMAEHNQRRSRRPVARELLMAVAAVAITLAVTASAGGSGATWRAPGKVIASDTAGHKSPLRFWEEIECVRKTRHSRVLRGGDARPTADGRPQGNTAYRRLALRDGDDFYGERCELGNNNHRAATAFYREGMRRITALSLRLPRNFPLGARRFQSVIQMKQAGPADNAGGTPVLELDAYGGRWRLRQSLSRLGASDSRQLWSGRARKGVWTRFLFDVTYSKKPGRGRIKLFVDRNGDGDFGDRRERTRTFKTYTLKVETAGTNRDGFKPGMSLPSHLRVGIYHDSRIRCPKPRGCRIHVDNVQVLRP